MVIIIDENFNVISVSDAVVNQGDGALGRIQVVAPFPNNLALLASFTLPDGTVTPRYPLINSISTTDKTKTIYTFNIPATVFSLLAGSVQVQFFALLPDSKKISEYSCLINVKSGGTDTSGNGLYAITPVYVCDKSLTSKTPEIINVTDDSGTVITSRLSVTLNEDNNAYYVSGWLYSADTSAPVTVKVTYATPQTIATTATNFTIRQGTAFNLPAFGDIDQNTWNYIVSTLADLEVGVSTAIQGSINTLDSTTHNMWALKSGYYIAKKGAVVYLTKDQTQSLSNTVNDALILVTNETGLSAVYTYIGQTDGVPTILYGNSDGTNYLKSTFTFGDYVTEQEVSDMINSAVISVLNTPV